MLFLALAGTSMFGASLIGWFAYSVYLHARFGVRWKGSRLALLSTVGFRAVVFTYQGVSHVLSGLHSYG